MSNSKDGTKAKLHFTVCEFKKVQKLFLRREREGRREGAGGSLLTLETRAGPVRTKSHHHLANNLGKVLVFFSLCAPLLVQGVGQVGVLVTSQDSALTGVLLTLASLIHPLTPETWPGAGSAHLPDTEMSTKAVLSSRHCCDDCLK